MITAATNTSSAVEPGHESPTDQGALIVNNIPNRSTEMLLMHEELARAHNQARFEERLRHERSLRVVRAHRAQRRAEHAVVRARHLLSLASAY